MRQRHDAGFTLTEIMIVTSVLSILATIAVPNLVRGRMNANESAAASTLGSIAKAQMQMRSMGLVDTNGDGVGEYGTLGEITGTAPVRGTSAAIRVPLLSAALGKVDPAGRVTRHGYNFALYLPDAAGNGVAETASTLASVDAIKAAAYWTCLAWPASEGQTGQATLFINQQGQMLRATNASYSGTGNAPPPGAALPGSTPGRIDLDGLAVGAVGAAGNTWVMR